MLRKQALAQGETYHIYNRGANKQRIFTDDVDYSRFMLLMYLANTQAPVNLRALFKEYKGRSFVDVYDNEKISPRLVDLLAYSLMPNHFHMVVRQRTENGITTFMKKLATGYSMYFNTKYEHSGTLFQGRFKSSHIDSEEYFRYIFAYVHLNPLDIFQPNWKKDGVKDKKDLQKFLSNYQYSSFADYPYSSRPESRILSVEEMPDFLRSQNDLEDLLKSTKDRPLLVV